LRRACSTRKIDIRAALDDAAKVIGAHCTGDALVQQLVKRERRIMDQWAAEGTPLGRPSKKKSQDAALESGAEDASPKAKPAIDSPASAPGKPATRTKKVASSKNATTNEVVPSTPCVKAEKATDDEPSTQTPSPVQYESDSEYTESPDKAKKKRVRGIARKVSQKSSTKKARKQLSDSDTDSDTDSDDDTPQTPTRKPAAKPIQRRPVKKISATAVNEAAQVRPGTTTRKSLPKPETTKQSAQEDIKEKVEAETYVGVQDPEVGQSNFDTLAGLTPSASYENTQLHHEVSPVYPDHGSFDNTPHTSNHFDGNSLNSFSFRDGYLSNQLFSDNGFGGPLWGGDLNSLYQNQFNPSSNSVSGVPMSTSYPDTMASAGTSGYVAMER
jgi:hypothetical protein